MTRLDELRAALRDATEAANHEWRGDKPRLAVCQELSREEQRLRVEIVEAGGCCGWRYESPVGPRCGCSAVRQYVAETLIDSGVRAAEAHEWADYCSHTEAFAIVRGMRQTEACSGISIHTLMRVANECVNRSENGAGAKTGGNPAADCQGG